MAELTVHIDDKPVVVKTGPKTLLVDVACMLEEKGYKLNVALPEIFVDGKMVDPYEKVDRRLKYKFCK